MINTKHVRIYTDETGESHFEDLDTELVFMDFAPPAAPVAIAPFLTGGMMQWLSAPLGWEGDAPHPVAKRSLFITTQGEYEVTASDGDVRKFREGSVFLLEDTWGKGHQTKITGDIDMILVAVTLTDPETLGR